MEVPDYYEDEDGIIVCPDCRDCYQYPDLTPKYKDEDVGYYELCCDICLDWI